LIVTARKILNALLIRRQQVPSTRPHGFTPVHPDTHIHRCENLPAVIKDTAGFAETWYHAPVYTDLTKQKKFIFIAITVRTSNLRIHLVT
jgi:hypothetical protein